jgi:hypothetical protein
MKEAPHDARLVWVTRSVAINPANVLEVFHGNAGQIEVYFTGRTCHFSERELTDEGRALLLPPDVAGGDRAQIAA